MSQINVTPLVDVMLVLLIIFMVTAPMMQAGISVNLPSAATRSNPSQGGLILTVSKDRYIYIEDKPIHLMLLEETLKNRMAMEEKKIVFLRADQDVPYGFVISVMDAIKKAGIETVGMIVQPKEK
jgi:biopolymer transport protein TolR